MLGASGSGKTTLLRLIAGLDEPSAGSVLIDGASPHEARVGQAHRVRAAVAGPAAVAHRRPQRPAAAGGEPRRIGRADALDRRTARRGGPRRVRRRLPARAVGRDAPARRPGPGDGPRGAAAADGRTVRRARRDHPRRDAPPARRTVRADGDHGRVRHPLGVGGGVPLRPGRRAVDPAGPRSSGSSRSSWPARATPSSRTRPTSSPSPSGCGDAAASAPRCGDVRRACRRDGLNADSSPRSSASPSSAGCGSCSCACSTCRSSSFRRRRRSSPSCADTRASTSTRPLVTARHAYLGMLIALVRRPAVRLAARHVAVPRAGRAAVAGADPRRAVGGVLRVDRRVARAAATRRCCSWSSLVAVPAFVFATVSGLRSADADARELLASVHASPLRGAVATAPAVGAARVARHGPVRRRHLARRRLLRRGRQPVGEGAGFDRQARRRRRQRPVAVVVGVRHRGARRARPARRHRSSSGCCCAGTCRSVGGRGPMPARRPVAPADRGDAAPTAPTTIGAA